MTSSKITASNPATSPPPQPPAQDPSTAPAPALFSTSQDGLAPRHAPTAGPTASLPPRTAQFLNAARRATLEGQQDQRAIVDQFLKQPEAEVKAAINGQDDNGDSALHMLVKSKSLHFMSLPRITDDNVDLLRPLLLHGADPRLPNQEGKTPVQYVDRFTRVHLVPHFAYELAQSGPLNKQRLERNHAAYAADPAKARSLADARRLARDTFRALGRMFQGPNRLAPYLPADSVRFLSHLPTPSMANTSRFFGPAQHAEYSLFDADGRVSAHVAQARRGPGRRDGNNLILRFEPGDAGRPVLKGLVFPSTRENAAGEKRYQPHTTAYGGGAFAFAGEISADAEGRITAISNKSGHNHTSPVLGAAVTLYMQAQGLLADDFTMALVAFPDEDEYRGTEAFDKAKEFLAQRWQAINPAACARLAQNVSALEERLQALGDASPGHRSERSALSRERSLVYGKLQRAQAERHFLRLIGYSPATGSVNPDAAPRGSYRPAPAAEPATLPAKRKQPGAAPGG